MEPERHGQRQAPTTHFHLRPDLLGSGGRGAVACRSCSCKDRANAESGCFRLRLPSTRRFPSPRTASTSSGQTASHGHLSRQALTTQSSRQTRMSPSWNGTSAWDWSRADRGSGRRSNLRGDTYRARGPSKRSSPRYVPAPPFPYMSLAASRDLERSPWRATSGVRRGGGHRFPRGG